MSVEPTSKTTSIYVNIPNRGRQTYTINGDLEGVDERTILTELREMIKDKEGYTCDFGLKKECNDENDGLDNSFWDVKIRGKGGSTSRSPPTIKWKRTGCEENKHGLQRRAAERSSAEQG